MRWDGIKATTFIRQIFLGECFLNLVVFYTFTPPRESLKYDFVLYRVITHESGATLSLR